jgi:release factor glutamine methyltransferase
MQTPLKTERPEWTIIKLIQWATTYFDTHDIDSPRVTAELLLAYVLNLERVDLYLRYDQPLNQDELDQFKAMIKRRIKREPVAYILGTKEFWSLDLEITRDVLIPRPETECLVEKALDSLSAGPQASSKFILELGTGSGAVILSLASQNPQLTYWATDLSIQALKVARQNARRHHLNEKIHFIAGDWLKPFSPGTCAFDMIVSNPPYIKTSDLAGLQPEIHAHEPLMALDGDADGLRGLRHIIQGAHLYLKPCGKVILEIGHDQKDNLTKIITECDAYAEIIFHKDYGGHDRVLEMQKKPKG